MSFLDKTHLAITTHHHRMSNKPVEWWTWRSNWHTFACSLRENGAMVTTICAYMSTLMVRIFLLCHIWSKSGLMQLYDHSVIYFILWGTNDKVYLQYNEADVIINQPLNTLSFDPAKQGPSLISGGHLSINPGTLAPSLDKLGHVVSIFSDIHGLITNYLPVTPVYRPSTVSTIHWSPSAPTTMVTSPTPYTPLLLSRFLQYLWNHLGISNTISYENALLQHGYSPDILHKVPSKDLENLGISAGDVIQLKEACLPWFIGPLIKHKHHDDGKP